MNRLENELAELKANNLYRKRLVIASTAHFPIITLVGPDGGSREVVSFASNNYLGLGQSTALSEPTVQMSSPLVTGYTAKHQELEKKLASLKGTNSALLFSSGFTTNSALLSTLVGPKDAVLLDKYCHASLMEITRDPSKNFHSFQHKRYDLARKQLVKLRPRYEVIYLVSDSVFSMEGDEADLSQLTQLAREFDATLILDDAHAIGCYGKSGEGFATADSVQLPADKLIISGTLSKALGSYGGFVCASETIIDYLVNKARPYIYSTALPIIHVEAAHQHLDIIETLQPQTQLWGNIAFITQKLGITTHPPHSPIIKIPVGDNEKAIRLSAGLLAAGFHVPAIRYPTVPRKDAMLRVSLSASHTFEQLGGLCAALAHGTITA